jgi:hypothetical protein
VQGGQHTLCSAPCAHKAFRQVTCSLLSDCSCVTLGQLFAGPRALKLGIVERAADGLSVEYGDLRFVLRPDSCCCVIETQAAAAHAPQDDR